MTQLTSNDKSKFLFYLHNEDHKQKTNLFNDWAYHSQPIISLY